MGSHQPSQFKTFSLKLLPPFVVSVYHLPWAFLLLLYSSSLEPVKIFKYQMGVFMFTHRAGVVAFINNL